MNILYSSNHKKRRKKRNLFNSRKKCGQWRISNHEPLRHRTETMCLQNNSDVVLPQHVLCQKRETSLVSHVRLLRPLQEKFYRYGLGTIAISRKPLAKTAKIKHANLITESHYHKLFGTYVKLVTFEIECLHMKSDSFVFSFSHSVIFNIIYNQRFKKYS